jgi:DEAD/DEAH box helicase domain-containing protein
VTIEALVDWLCERPYYRDQVVSHRVEPARAATTRSVELDSRLERALAERGIETPYRHQAAAIEAVRDGENVVLATPTASGKSLAYTVPAVERAMDRGATTLYVGPQRALINDQEDTLDDLAHDLGFGSRVDVAQYTGRLDRSEKQAVRERRPTVLLTTPDMLHYGILPHGHRLWDWFLSRLETVVVDEVHEYRGVFGSHVSLVFRRLNRVCERFDADPQYVCCSATIGNPTDHAATVTGRSADAFRAVETDDSAAGPTHWLVWNPPEYEDERGRGSGRRRSSHAETKRLFVDLLSRGLQTVAFTRSRQTAERYAEQSAADLRERGDHDLAANVGAYQAALPRDRRAEIETALHDGSLRGVWSTNALELGVDVGGLDAVVIDGYPGTRMATNQQAGRAGRGTDASLVVLVTGEDQLDQYVARNPETLFEGDPEDAVANPGNERLLPAHVASAARENWLCRDDERHFGPTFPDVVADLTDAGDLERVERPEGLRWTYDGGASPQHECSLRTIEDRSVDLIDRASGDRIADLPFGDALRDAHPGAVYHHQGQTYEVADLNLDRDRAELSPTWADWYTQVLTEKDVAVETVHRDRELPSGTPVHFADITVTERVVGYERRDSGTGERLSREPLDLPETTLRTEALFYTLPPAIEQRLRDGAAALADDGATDGTPADGTAGGPADGAAAVGRAVPSAAAEWAFGGALHAAEHATIALFPLQLLCDRRDVGGLSTPAHPDTGRPTVFVYDGHPGGVGLARSGYDRVQRLLADTRTLIEECDCAAGCPACVQSPHCGNANEPLTKGLAVDLLGAVLD